MKNNYLEYIERAKNRIKDLLKEKNSIFITGKNMSGKSDILQKLVKELNLKENIYFIDTPNRAIYESEIILNSEIGTPIKINERRIFSEYFNKIDTFESGEKYTGPNYAYQVLKKLYLEDSYFKEKLQKFLEDFNVKIEWKEKIVFYIDDIPVNISSGYQALLRLFTEIYYFYENYKVRIFIIDEIDAHLDNSMNRNLIKKISYVFPEIVVVATAHSVTFFEEMPYSKIIILNGDTYSFRVQDSNDLGNLDYINREVFNSYSEKNDKNIELARLKEIYSSTINNILPDLETREYIKKIQRDTKNSKEKEIIEIEKIIKNDNWITIDKIFEKVFKGEELNHKEELYLKEERDFTSDENIKKQIIKKTLKLGIKNEG